MTERRSATPAGRLIVFDRRDRPPERPGERRASPAAFVHTLIADLLRRARRFPEAEHAADEAANELAELAADDGEHSWALEIARYIGSLAATEDDSAHCCADAFTRDE